MCKELRLLVCFAVLGGLIGCDRQADEQKEPDPGVLRILCYGDSITRGMGTDLLKKMLEEAGVETVFAIDANGGRRMSRVTSGEVREMFNAHPDLDMIILLMGINDLIENRNTVDATISLMSGLLDQCAENAPKARILVGNLVPNAADDPVTGYDPAGSYVGSEDKVLEFNKRLPDVVKSKKATGMKVEIVDLHSKLGREDLSDGIHPNRSGYNKMAQAWFEAIMAGSTKSSR